MFMKKLSFLLFGGLLFLCGCQGPVEWGEEWSKVEPSATPSAISETDLYGGAPDDNTIKTVSVLLPLSGAGGNLGIGIQHAIEIAFFQKQPRHIMVSFHDIGGTPDDKRRVIDMVLSNNPDMLIGPLFADDVEILKSMKPTKIPALTFTSAKRVLGDGIFTLALLPNQAVESIVKQIKSEDKSRLVILAPETQTGYMLANNAIESAKIYDVDIAGLYFYEEQNTDEMKNLAEDVSMYKSRVDNLMHAKEILADVLINQKMTLAEKEPVRLQLEDLNKRDSLGDVPYDAILFLGSAGDSKQLGSYLRYYDVSAGQTMFYGSALWDTEISYRDAALADGEYAGLPRISDDFVRLYSEIEGARPNRFNTIGYDAAMLAIKSLSGGKPVGAYLLDPSGYYGLDGLVRLLPNGENERALSVMQLNGVRRPAVKKQAPQNFIKPIYQTTRYNLTRPSSRKISSDGYSPMDYINLPERFADKYDSKTFGEYHDDNPIDNTTEEAVEVIPEDVSAPVTNPEFQPAKLDTIDKQLIDEVKMKAN
ncbi:MAG: penicillin-binding protein activator [Rickettsiales bacterium]|jgi:hypothetical protein|nr:penicillin-binding protein activator [Rickettsiales bacterium]